MSAKEMEGYSAKGAQMADMGVGEVQKVDAYCGRNLWIFPDQRNHRQASLGTKISQV